MKSRDDEPTLGDETPDDITAYAAERRRLLHDFGELPHAGSGIDWQRQLADAIMRAERDSADRARTKGERLDAKRHRHLLRVIGDGLVHTLLPSHTIRSLSRHPGKPAHLTSQGDDFEFVFDSARAIASLGGIPILSDLTTLIGIGDIVTVLHDGVAVIECKNRPAPDHPPTGRPARQQQRGESAVDYLANSYIEEDGGHRIAYESPLPDPDFELVERLLHECIEHPQGTAVHAYADDDLFIAATEDAPPDVVMAEIAKIMDATEPGTGELAMVGISFLGELVEAATYRRLSPSNYPIAPQLRWRLLERELHLIRIVNMGALAAEVGLDDGRMLTLTPRRGEHGFEVAIEGTEADQSVFTHEVAELCVWTPISVESLRGSLIEQAKQALTDLAAIAGGDMSTVSAYGDNIIYNTLYRPLTSAAHDQAKVNGSDGAADTSDAGPGEVIPGKNHA
ncbi:hypothetical protein GL325_06035 [Aeromicrobium sp. 636]|uniref:Uncharacterized protein n=1 Tax=Aeromicrobium senzhongii TaxID=2663859 RepID=A0A8I0EVG0_9ACTN|nr:MULTISPECIES: hypothetical protein [Aeromicrobium]MBC9225872.1 hypothetical protein [Aeromicrobium senzhongii]MCQ3997979.1 hypothetical protein [Aeromicrobium sp. 636]